MELRLPLVLDPVVGQERLEVRGHSIPEVLEDAFAQVPVLRHHLMLESGHLRPHILCLHNGVSIDRKSLAGIVLSDGDEIWIHQAISGG